MRISIDRTKIPLKTAWICEEIFPHLVPCSTLLLMIDYTGTLHSAVCITVSFFYNVKVAPPFTHCKCHMRFNERGALFSLNESFSARFNVSPYTRFPSPLSLPLLWHTLWRWKTSLKKTTMRKKGGLVWLARKSRFRFQPATQKCCLTWFIFIHHNEQSSCFSVARVQTGLLFSC